jgi:hypothetical protein
VEGAEEGCSSEQALECTGPVYIVLAHDVGLR